MKLLACFISGTSASDLILRSLVTSLACIHEWRRGEDVHPAKETRVIDMVPEIWRTIATVLTRRLFLPFYLHPLEWYSSEWLEIRESFEVVPQLMLQPTSGNFSPRDTSSSAGSHSCACSPLLLHARPTSLCRMCISLGHSK